MLFIHETRGPFTLPPSGHHAVPVAPPKANTFQLQCPPLIVLTTLRTCVTRITWCTHAWKAGNLSDKLSLSDSFELNNTLVF